MSVNGSPERRERRSACSIRSSSSTRFGRPVSGSRRASEWALSEPPVEHDAARGGDEREEHERGDDVVGRLAEDRGEQARDEHERRQGESPCERAAQMPPPGSDRHSSPFCPPAGAAAGLSDSSAELDGSSPPERVMGIPRER